MRVVKFFSIFAALFLCGGASAQESTQRNVVVQGEANEFEEPGDYGQPQWAERSQASSTTKLYVLSAYEVFAGFFFETGKNPVWITEHEWRNIDCLDDREIIN